MEIDLSEENPTAGDSGASIEERLIAKFSAQPEQPAQTQAPEAKAQEAAPAEVETTEVPENGEPADDSQPQLSTSELAKIFGLEESAFDVDGDGQPVIKTKIDGKEGAAKLADLVKSYQLQGHAENRAREAAEAQKAADARMQEVEQQAQARMQHVENLANIAQAQLTQRYQSIDWQTMRQTDPGQYAALQEDFRQQNAQIGQMLAHTNQEKQKQLATMDGQRLKAVQEQGEKLSEVIPEWKDATVRQKETQEIWKLAQQKGVPAEVLQIISDGLTTPYGVIPPSASLISILRDGLMQQKLQQSKPAIENKVRTAPKIVKPGQSTQSTQETRMRDLSQNVKKTGGKGGSLEALLIARGIA